MNDDPSLPAVVVLISGRGSNLRAIVEQAQGYRVARVLSDVPTAGGLDVARRLGIETHVVTHVVTPVVTPAVTPAVTREVTREVANAVAHAVPGQATLDRASYDRRLGDAIDAAAPALIVLAGFMRILSTEFVDRYAGRIVNIHPSLLPRHPGLHTHRNALAAGDRVHGATVHFVTAELDGGPPIMQARVPIRPGDDEATLAARVLTEEHRIYPLAVNWYCSGRLRCHDGLAWLDGQALTTPLQYAAGVRVTAC